MREGAGKQVSRYVAVRLGLYIDIYYHQQNCAKTLDPCEHGSVIISTIIGTNSLNSTDVPLSNKQTIKPS